MRKILTNFRGGEVSDRVAGRMDSADYDQTCRTLENFLLHPSGGADFRPGTYYCGVSAATSSVPVRLVPFVRSKTEAYILEIVWESDADQYIRVWHNGELVQSGGSALKIPLPWSQTGWTLDLSKLRYIQTEDAIYFAHPDTQLLKIRFTAQDSWSVTTANFSLFLGVAHDTSPYTSIYSYNSDVFEKKLNPGTLPGGIGNGCVFSADGVYYAVVHTGAPYVTIYKRNEDTFTKLTNPASLPTGTGHGCAFSSDGVYFAVAHDTSRYITIYKRTGDSFIKLDDPGTLPTGTGLGCAFSSDGVYLAVSTLTAPYITIYKRSGDTFTKLDDPAALPAGPGYGVSFSSDNVYLAIAVSGSAPYIAIYKRNVDRFTKLADPGALPAGNAYGCSFSPNGVYLSLVHTTSPYVTIYKRTGDIFTKLANPAALPTGTGSGCSFSADSVYLAVVHTTAPFVTIYKRVADTFTKLADPETTPTGNGNGCAFSMDGWAGIPWGTQYPAALIFHEQRLTVARGRTVWASRVGYPQDFSQDAADTSYGYEYPFAANQLEDILWMLSKNHNIILGSGMGEWLMTGGDAPLTSANVYVDRVSAHGSANIAAIMANESILFVQDGSQRLREFLYSQERGGYISPDLSRWADHIGRKNFVEMAWQRSPASLLWMVRENGELAALTLDRNYGIQAWHRHPTDGTVESVAVIPGANEDIVYMAVKRSLDDINLLDHADCESTDAPHITGDGASTSNCTFERSNEQAYKGTYSYKLTKTIAAGTMGYARLCDNENTDDMHELVAGKKYQLTAWIYVPSSGGPLVNEVRIYLQYYNSGAWAGEKVTAVSTDVWEQLNTGEIVIPATATGVRLYIYSLSSASQNEYFYVDNVKLTQVNPGGNPKKYIEYLKPIDWGDDEEDCFLVDSGLTIDYSAKQDPMTAATQAEPVVVHSGEPGLVTFFLDGDIVRITGVVGMTELNGNCYIVKNPFEDSYELYELDGITPVDGTLFESYISGGLCEYVVKTLDDLDHLEGETVAVYADGVELGDEEVYVGSITIDEYASKIHVGLPYTGKLRPQRLGQFMKSKIQETVLMLYKTRGGKIGSNEDNLNAIQHADDELLTGTVDARIQGTFSREGDLIIVQDQPLPMTVLAIAADLEAN